VCRQDIHFQPGYLLTPFRMWTMPPCVVVTLRYIQQATIWRSNKYEDGYLHAYDSVSAAKQGLDRYITKYNQICPHSSLDRMTPDEFYFSNLPPQPKAA
jgi:transposase InsO family protein